LGPIQTKLVDKTEENHRNPDVLMEMALSTLANLILIQRLESASGTQESAIMFIFRKISG
jgi:hypothetical protein